MARVIYAIVRYTIPPRVRDEITKRFKADRIVYVKVPFINSNYSTEEKIQVFCKYMDKRVRDGDTPVAVIVSRAPLITLLATIWAIKKNIPIIVTHNSAERPDDVLTSIFKKRFTWTVFTPWDFLPLETMETVRNVQ